MKTKLKGLIQYGLIVTVLFLTACNGAFYKDKCLETVKKQFPHSQIYKRAGVDFIFIVIDSTGVKLVTTLYFTSTEIDKIESLIKVN